MYFNSEIGKIYDSIFFFYEYYNEDIVQRDFINRYNDSQYMLHCFNQIKNKIKLPEFLCPLFCAGDVRANLISDFFAEKISFHDDTIDSFISKILSNVDQIYQKLIDRVFENYQSEKSIKIFPSIAPAGYLEAINALNADPEYKLQVSLLFGNFNYAISLFTELLRKIYLLVDELHGKYKNEIEKEFEAIQSESRLKLYREELQFSFDSNDNTFVSISLLNQFIILTPIKRGSYSELLFGLKHSEALNRNSTDTISVDDFFIACGNELRLKILYSLSENYELTLSQLSKIHNTAATTILRHIDLLTEARLIKVSKRKGLQIFYKINGNLFQNMQSVLIDFLYRIQNTKGEKTNDK